MAVFPTAVKTFTTHSNGGEVVAAEHINDIQAEVAAIENVIGPGSQYYYVSGIRYAYGTLRDRFAVVESGTTRWYSDMGLGTAWTANSLGGGVYSVTWPTWPTSGQYYASRDTTNGLITVPVAGLYSVSAQVNLSVATTIGSPTTVGYMTSASIVRKPSGGSTFASSLADQTTMGTSLSLGGLVELAAGDTLRLQVTPATNYTYSLGTLVGSGCYLGVVLERSI